MGGTLGSLFFQRWGSASAIALDSFLEYSQNIILSVSNIHILTSTNFQISSSDKLFLMKFTNLDPPCQTNSMGRKCVGWRTGTRTSARGCTAGCVYIYTLLTLNSVTLGSLRIPGTILRPPLIIYRGLTKKSLSRFK